ncbi:hypothetical protein ACOMHN_029896 [Nucella lapillus]
MDIAVNSTKIIFNSPSFPANYPRPLSCKWLFTAADNSVINFRIVTFDVFTSIFCLKDVLDIFDDVMQTWWGTRPVGQTIQTSTQHARMTFQAVTVGDDHTGFEFEVWSEINYTQELGEAELGPANLTLVAVSVSLFFIFVVFIIVIKRHQCTRKRMILHTEI